MLTCYGMYLCYPVFLFGPRPDAVLHWDAPGRNYDFGYVMPPVDRVQKPFVFVMNIVQNMLHTYTDTQKPKKSYIPKTPNAPNTST